MSAIRQYVTGIGWCWVEDGEILEVISASALVGCGAATTGSALGPSGEPAPVPLGVSA